MENPAVPSSFGRKVFFLYPPSVVRDEVVSRLLEQEFEVYLLKSHADGRRLLAKYPDSIMFVNIDEGQTESEWEAWIREVFTNPETENVEIGIVSYNNDEALQRKYLMEVGIQCGFIRLKIGLEESIHILLETLKANEAKGRRKYVRADCAWDNMAVANLRMDNKTLMGDIKDISVVGLSCTFVPDPGFAKNSLVEDLQLKLRGVLLKVQGIVFGSRMENSQNTYVILFTNRLDDQSRVKIRRYIQTALQMEIEAELG